jgi:pyruvate formate lyase activating enzyme
MDPIEKKPLYHFYPGTDILSVGTIGCNLGCKFCQNWHIAQKESPTEEVSSEQLIEVALRHHSIGIAYTYSEPLVWYEFILDTAKAAKKAGLHNVLVTNGLIHREPLEELLQYIDGMNLDVKAFRQDFYKEICGGGDLTIVQQTAEIAAKHCHLEVTTLLIPGLNDAPGEVKEMTEWLGHVSPDIPLHLSRYFPQYQLDLPPTPLESLEQAREIARQSLHYVYLGNVPDEDRSTYCHVCQHPVVKRTWQSVQVNLLDGACPECGTMIPIVM